MNTEHPLEMTVSNDPISDFVENVRAEQHPRDMVKGKEDMAVQLKLAQRRSEKAIIEAEKFRARIEPPQGMCETIQPQSNIPNIGSGVSDDDFFHLTCHIDPSLIHKIEKGEFIELEKLLPKDKINSKTEESRLEWVQRDGGTFLNVRTKSQILEGGSRLSMPMPLFTAGLTLIGQRRYGNISQ